MSSEKILFDSASGEVKKKFYILMSYDPFSALKQCLIAIPNFGSHSELDYLVSNSQQLIQELLASVQICGGNANSGHSVHSDQMLYSPKLIIYADLIHYEKQNIIDQFGKSGNLIDLYIESEMLNSVFISYGGPDEEIAHSINQYLISQNVKTWFFPDDALPGQKLHRVMSEGVLKHDRVILICSESSLQRPGVLNELERVLEREAKEGGSEILIPIAIDDYVFQDWAPARSDIAEQVRSRVICVFPKVATETEPFEIAAAKLLKALKR